MEKDFEQNKNVEGIDEASIADIKNPFDPKQINITVKPLIIDSLIKRMQSTPARINLQTEFQRKSDLWSVENQSRLIESLLVKIPLPAFYFDGTDDNNWKIVDGLQRLSALKNFVIDKNLRLSKLEYLKEFNEFSFDDLPLYLRTRVEETQVTAYIINPGTPEAVKYNLFKRINTGGLVLTPQEIRHALNQGIPAEFLKELASMNEFRKATNWSLNSCERMEDRDFVMRFIGFYNGYEHYGNDLDEFLNSAMSNLKKISQKERDQIKKDFSRAMNAAHKIFDNDAFRKRYNSEEGRKPLNKALFDTWAVNLSKITDAELVKIISNKEKIKSKFMELMNSDADFHKAITSATGDSKSIMLRFEIIRALIREVLNDNTN